MPAKSKQTGKPASVSLNLAKAVLALSDKEAALIEYGQSRAEFYRMLIAAADGRATQVRPKDAPKRRPLRKAKSPLKQFHLSVPAAPRAALDRIAGEAGQISRSGVITLLVLDWCGISPLTLRPPDPDETLPDAPLSPSSRTSRADSYVALTLAHPVLTLAEEEARLLGGAVGRAQFIRMLIDRASGLGADMPRDRRAPKRKPLSTKKTHALKRMQLAIAPEQQAGLDKLSFLAGSISRSAIVTQLILDWCGMGPFRLHRPIAHLR